MLNLLVNANDFPEYNQQCQDDAGTPYLDDDEIYGGKKYHDGSKAIPILVGPNKDECPSPLETACATRETKKTAYLEGPLECGGNGWFCRILEDPNWKDINLKGDLNFGYCNSTSSAESDQSGHCHGSSHDETYYWWLRDHWFRQYNGRLRCCCGWTGKDAVTNGGIANRCDYRRLVTKDEDVSKCRDANEEHGLGWEGGCDEDKLDEQMGKPIPEDDAKCWEVHNFGHTEKRDGSCPRVCQRLPTRLKCKRDRCSRCPECEEEHLSEEIKFLRAN